MKTIIYIREKKKTISASWLGSFYTREIEREKERER
jgi:hypothetical protein